MANPTKKNAQNEKRNKPPPTARPETARAPAKAAPANAAGDAASAAVPATTAPVAGAAAPAAPGKAQPRAEAQARTPSQDQIAKRAYQIFQARGGQHGRHAEDWKQAEQELKLGTQ